MERACYRRIGQQPCPCPAFRAGDERVVSAPSATATVFRNGVLTLLLVVMGLALLYAYRSQTPAVPSVTITEAISDVNAGQVARVTITGNRATIELRDGTKRLTNLPDGAAGDDPLTRAITAYNQANPARQVQLRYEQTDPSFSVIGSVLLSLLPVLLIGGFFYYSMNVARRRRDDGG
jgi:ATP-dependent Zn protease